MSRIQPCEMCGAEAPVTLVEIDHVQLHACPKCARFGKPVVPKRSPRRSSQRPQSGRPADMNKTPYRQPRRPRPPEKDFLHDKILVDGYGELIQEARRTRGLGRGELAQMIKEKETLLARIETEKVLPTDRVIQKIERELEIELKTEISEESTAADDLIPRSTTLGSIAKIKRKKK
ncbi:MAG: multiprotein bridging factor aMBF1 [Candidatus Heimdallarchaeota archaeon]